MIDEKAVNPIALAEQLEAHMGLAERADLLRDCRLAASVIRRLVLESAKLKEAEGWVLVPKEPSEEQIEAMVDAYRTTRRPGVCGMTIDAQFRAEFAPWFAAYRAMLSAAGDKE